MSGGLNVTLEHELQATRDIDRRNGSQLHCPLPHPRLKPKLQTRIKMPHQARRYQNFNDTSSTNFVRVCFWSVLTCAATGIRSRYPFHRDMVDLHAWSIQFCLLTAWSKPRWHPSRPHTACLLYRDLLETTYHSLILSWSLDVLQHCILAVHSHISSTLASRYISSLAPLHSSFLASISSLAAMVWKPRRRSLW